MNLGDLLIGILGIACLFNLLVLAPFALAILIRRMFKEFW